MVRERSDVDRSADLAFSATASTVITLADW